ncbi:fasciclin domain-containing protein, partial [Rhabdobacter roseus]
MKPFILRKFILLSCLCMGLGSLTVRAQGNLVEVAAGNPDFSILVQAVQKAGLVEALQGEGPLTVFAPTNAAFGKALAALNLNSLDDIPQDQLRSILLYHVVAGSVGSRSLRNGQRAATLQGEEVEITVFGNFEMIKVNNSNVVLADVEASNGLIHVLDEVLLPPMLMMAKPNLVEVAAGNPDFSILVQAVQKAGLVEALQGEGPLTVFAPTNAAFGKALAALNLNSLDDIPQDQLRSILLYHVVAGSVGSRSLRNGQRAATLQGEEVEVAVFGNFDLIKVNNSNVVLADVEASNGLIHVIDEVLLPPMLMMAKPNLVEVAAGNPDFSILVQAVQKAGLVEALQGEGPLTVFAPTNAAFGKALAALNLNSLDDIPQDQLRSILLYHVVAGSVGSRSLRNGQRAATLQGEEVEVAVFGNFDLIKVNNSNVVLADVEASNGLIHVID